MKEEPIELDPIYSTHSQEVVWTHEHALCDVLY